MLPQALKLYDAFVRYILANVKDGGMLGFDLLRLQEYKEQRDHIV